MRSVNSEQSGHRNVLCYLEVSVIQKRFGLECNVFRFRFLTNKKKKFSLKSIRYLEMSVKEGFIV